MSNNSIDTINSIRSLMTIINERIEVLTIKNKSTYYDTMKYLYIHPYFDSVDLREYLSLTKPTISKIINELVNLGIIVPLDNKQRYVRYVFKEYVDILEKGAEL